MQLNSTHKSLIARTVEHHGALTTDFHRVVWALIGPEAQEDRLDYAWLKSVAPFVPDAYSIDPIRQRMTLFEVEVNSRLKWPKLNRIGSFSVHMILFGWRVTLIRVDEFGRYRKEPLERVIKAGYLEAQAA